MKKGFTLIELVVAVALMAMVIFFASTIFKVSIGAHRTARANAEIMQKLRAITDQLNADFKGLRKDGEIFVVWVAVPVDPAHADDYDLDGHMRFDRIMFFADGDFQSYNVNPKPIRGNVARICYMLANRPAGIIPTDPLIRAPQQEPEKRILARTQHILTAADPNFLYFDLFNANDWYMWHNRCEYDRIFLHEWKNILFANKKDVLSVIADVTVLDSDVPENVRGAIVKPTDSNSIHILMCEGVGEFKVQGWYDEQKRWFPEVDPSGDGDLSDSDFFTTGMPLVADPCKVPGLLYPSAKFFVCGNSTVTEDVNSLPRLVESHFNAIPGLGRALKFTFTLYDSKGILEKSRTFTHIVYLDN